MALSHYFITQKSMIIFLSRALAFSLPPQTHKNRKQLSQARKKKSCTAELFGEAKKLKTECKEEAREGRGGKEWAAAKKKNTHSIEYHEPAPESDLKRWNGKFRDRKQRIL